ncbi:MAG: Flp family type IVb pilin [Polyangiales bacterium]|jgi:pilus assembly protein Flp/PilA
MNKLSLIRAKAILDDKKGANLVEYIILVGVIALIAIAGFKIFGSSVQKKVEEQAGSVGGINGTAK